MRAKAISLAVAVALLGTLVLIAPQASAAQISTVGGYTVPVTGADSNGNLFTGTVKIERFVYNSASHTIRAIGSITGTNGTGVIGTGRISFPVTPSHAAATTTACPILNLTLGPIRLNLLGLIVRTNTIHLSITAQPGPGNLLGNLLCDIAHLLDDNDLANVTNDLNTLLTLL